MELVQRIRELKARRNAVILAHNYALPEVQDIADFTGDSLALSIAASKVNAPVILFCGVRFMAETAKILSPSSTVLLPAADAGCPMADMADPAAVAQYRKEHPETILVAYVNTTAATKAEVDICCTSANADKVLRSLPADKPVLFLPDRNLGANTSKNCGRGLECWDGCCPIHDRITAEDIRRARAAHPNAQLFVHPECRPEVVALADKALSTGGMIDFVKNSAGDEFIVGTEIGILHRLVLDNPGKRFYPLEPQPCCADMKKVTLENACAALENMSPEITLPTDLMDRARLPIQRMLDLA